MPKKKKTKNAASKRKKADTSSIQLYLRYYGAIVFVALFLLLVANSTPTTVILSQSTTTVLGDDDAQKEAEKKQEEQKNEEEKKSEETRNEGQKQQEERKQEQRQEAEKTQQTVSQSSNTGSSNLPKATTRTESNTFRLKTDTEGVKQESEYETANGQKIKTKVEDDGKTKIELEQGGTKIKYVIENGKIVVKKEHEQDTDLSNDETEEIENEFEDTLENQGISLASDTAKPTFMKNNIRAASNFPLSFNPETKALIVTTPAGEKTLAILPDQAVENMLKNNILSDISSESSGTQSAQAIVTTYDGTLSYEIDGEKTHRIFGILPVKTPVKVFVSAETGEPLAKRQTVLTSLIDFLSPN